MNEKLARDGGTPVRTAPFPIWPVWDGADEKALLEVLRSGEWGRNAGTQWWRSRRSSRPSRAQNIVLRLSTARAL